MGLSALTAVLAEAWALRGVLSTLIAVVVPTLYRFETGACSKLIRLLVREGVQNSSIGVERALSVKVFGQQLLVILNVT